MLTELLLLGLFYVEGTGDFQSQRAVPVYLRVLPISLLSLKLQADIGHAR